MSTDAPLIGWLRVPEPGRPLGVALGRAGRAAVHRHLLPSEIWAQVTDPAHAGTLARMARTTRDLFPAIWKELEGLAEGLALPFEQVFAWNCRGELLATVPDGCTTVQLSGAEPLLAHNEDGLPFFHGHCTLLEVAPGAAPGFTVFCYPGSLPGHTFAVTTRGLVQTVNNLRLKDIAPEVPRMVLGRAVLNAGSVAEAIALLRAAPPSGGFHFTLAECGSAQLLSVEFGGGEVSTLPVTTPAVHANHALHLLRGLASQNITCSSRDRQARGTMLLAAGARPPLEVLTDVGGPGLPILRLDADDPDHENTLATAVFHVGQRSIRWQVHDRPREPAAYVQETRIV